MVFLLFEWIKIWLISIKYHPFCKIFNEVSALIVKSITFVQNKITGFLNFIKFILGWKFISLYIFFLHRIKKCRKLAVKVHLDVGKITDWVGHPLNLAKTRDHLDQMVQNLFFLDSILCPNFRENVEDFRMKYSSLVFRLLLDGLLDLVEKTTVEYLCHFCEFFCDLREAAFLQVGFVLVQVVN